MLGKFFVTTLKENRLISLSQEQGYIHLQQIPWTDVQLQSGIPVKLKEVPFKVQLFKVVATNGDIDWVITNRPQGSIALLYRLWNFLIHYSEKFYRRVESC